MVLILKKRYPKLTHSFIATLREDRIWGQVLPIEDIDVRGDEGRRGNPAEDLIPVHLDPEDPKQVTYIGASLQGPLKESLTRFLQENNDVTPLISGNANVCLSDNLKFRTMLAHILKF